jgi:hypothetical protein
VANAVMLWDGRWIDPDRIGGPATIVSIQTVLAETLQSQSVACRMELISGPVFLPVENRTGTMVLAMGTGTWRWTDMLTPAPSAATIPLGEVPR